MPCAFIAPRLHEPASIQGVQPITSLLPALAKAGFPNTDTLLTSPEGNRYAYAFRGDQYVYVKVDAITLGSEIIDGPKPTRRLPLHLMGLTFVRFTECFNMG